MDRCLRPGGHPIIARCHADMTAACAPLVATSDALIAARRPRAAKVVAGCEILCVTLCVYSKTRSDHRA